MPRSVCRVFATGVGVAAVVLATGFARAAVQNPPPSETEPRFEVTSIRATDMTPFTGAGVTKVPPIGVRFLPNGMTGTLATVEMLLLAAYQLRNFQLVGGPDWIRSERFDITARAAGEVTPDVGRGMLRTLLRDRFALRAHLETRQADVHALVLANADGRLGPRLKRTSPECVATLEARKKGTAPPEPPPNFELLRKQTSCGMSLMSGSASGASSYSMGGVGIDRLANQLQGAIAGPVVDRTGLTGLFDILLEYASPAQLQAAASAPDLTKDVAPPTIRDALREQLGLRLETGKGPLEVLVIESVSRPSNN
jgi:uncharacterized protein (TIGR03435 family)